jgi:glycosyltransferase involved in cell wall biosynthesis
VHGETLRTAARDDPRAQGRVEVVAHPSYVRWRERFVAPVTAAAPAVERVLVLGALRADKGRDDVPAVVAHLPAGTEVVVVGRTAPPPTWAAAADAAQVSLRVVGGSGPVPDEVLGRELAAGGVLLAPYTGATQSGTVVLALTCGIPVLAYAAGELPALLTAESLVSPPVPADLAAAYRRLRRHPWPTARVRPEELDEACAHDWGRVLAAFSR